MVIVNQDKTEIINFNKVENIYVSGRYISLNFELNNNEVVETYETEERGKEVLKEIMQCYANTEQYKCFCNMPEIIGETLNQLAENAFVYVMPKE